MVGLTVKKTFFYDFPSNVEYFTSTLIILAKHRKRYACQKMCNKKLTETVFAAISSVISLRFLKLEGADVNIDAGESRKNNLLCYKYDGS